jgi:hypothetical protein
MILTDYLVSSCWFRSANAIIFLLQHPPGTGDHGARLAATLLKIMRRRQKSVARSPDTLKLLTGHSPATMLPVRQTYRHQ